MDPYMTYSQLKASAKARMKPLRGTLIAAAAISLGFNLAVLLFFSRIRLPFVRSYVIQYILRLLFLTMSNTLRGMLKAGFHYLSLKICCDKPASPGDIFYAFSHQTGNAFLLSVFMSMIVVVPMIPYNIAAYWWSPTDMDHSILWMLLLLTGIPAAILTAILRLAYSQAFYLMLDFPSLSVKQLLQNSRHIMLGHKKRFFFIQLRQTLLLMIVCLFTCFIGGLWITPFLYMVDTQFYLDLVTKRDQITSPQAAGHLAFCPRE